MRLLILLLLLPINVLADWTENDTYREVVFQVVNFVDYKQTIQITRTPHLEETNAFLGREPSENAVKNYFIIHGLLHYGISRALPPEYRSAFQYLTIGSSGANVWINYRLEIRF